MKNGLRLFLAAIMFFCASTVVYGDEVISLKVGYQLLSPDGDLAAEVGGVGTRVDLEDDLDLDDSDDFTAEFGLSLGDFKLSVAYLPLSFTGDSTLSRSILYNGTVFNSGDLISSSVDVDIVDVGLTWYFLNFDDLPTRLQLGVELAAKITDAEASIYNVTLDRNETVSETVPIPTIGLRGRVALADFFGIVGRVGYLGFEDNYFLDADLQLEFSPMPLTGFYAGYRYLDIDIDESDLYLDSTFSGFYGGAFVRF